jgi:hypothetical protein
LPAFAAVLLTSKNLKFSRSDGVIFFTGLCGALIYLWRAVEVRTMLEACCRGESEMYWPPTSSNQRISLVVSALLLIYVLSKFVWSTRLHRAKH